MVRPHISHSGFKRRTLKVRLAWLAAAAMLLLSLLGFRMEIGADKVSFELALFRGKDQVDTERLALLEERLAEAVATIEVQSELTQYQLDARFNAFYQERDVELETFSRMLDRKMMDSNLKNAQFAVSLDEKVQQRLQEHNIKGSLK